MSIATGRQAHCLRRGRISLLAALSFSLLVAGCSGSAPSSAPASDSPQQPASQAAIGPYVITNNVSAPGPHLYIPKGRYVALGDSFASGEGNKLFDPATDTAAILNTHDICHRSQKNAYSLLLHVVDTHPGVPVPAAADFVACSGAKTQALFDYNQDNTLEAAQTLRLDAQYGPVSLITMSMGGNDVGFGSIIFDCVTNILYRPILASHRDPAFPTLGFGPCAASEQSALDTKLHWIDGTYPGNAQAGPACGVTCNSSQKCPPGSGCNPQNLIQVYQTLRIMAPQARILVLGYPREFKPGYSRDCQSVDRRDEPWANSHLTDALNNVIKSNIAAANVGVEYVDTVPYLANYPQCGGPGASGFWGIDAHLGTDFQGYFHPNNWGQRQLADAVVDTLRHPDPYLSQTPQSPGSPATPSSSAPTAPSVTPGSGGVADCSMAAFQRVLTPLTSSVIESFGLPRCAGEYGMGPFIIGVGNLPNQYYFKRGVAGNWVYLFNDDATNQNACKHIPRDILRQLIGVMALFCP
jgi:hypothetical protein